MKTYKTTTALNRKINDDINQLEKEIYNHIDLFLLKTGAKKEGWRNGRNNN